jgi:hypothetical protein
VTLLCCTSISTKRGYHTLSSGPTESYGSGVLRDVISLLARRVLGRTPSPLAEGHGGRLFWQPRTLSPSLIATTIQIEDAFVEGAVIGLLILHLRSFPLGMAMPSLLVHLAGTSSAFTRHAAELWTPDLVQSIDDHRQGQVSQFAMFCQIHLQLTVCAFTSRLGTIRMASTDCYCTSASRLWRSNSISERIS